MVRQSFEIFFVPATTKNQPKQQPRLSNFVLKSNNQTLKNRTKECQTANQEADINALKIENEALKLTNEASKLENEAFKTKNQKLLFILIFMAIGILVSSVVLGLNSSQSNDLRAKVQSLEDQQSNEEQLKKALYHQLTRETIDRQNVSHVINPYE